MFQNNYFIQVDDQLAWSSSIGPEDGEPGTVSWDTAEKNKAIEHHWFRSERQSLRRLPRSGGVVFTIRTYFHPITEICEEPYVPGRLASAVRSWGDDVSKYKGKEKYGEVLLEYLDKKHKEQVEAGLEVEKEEEVRAYPYWGVWEIEPCSGLRICTGRKAWTLGLWVAYVSGVYSVVAGASRLDLKSGYHYFSPWPGRLHVIPRAKWTSVLHLIHIDRAYKHYHCSQHAYVKFSHADSVISLLKADSFSRIEFPHANPPCFGQQHTA